MNFVERTGSWNKTWMLKLPEERTVCMGEVLVVEDGKEIGEEPGTYWLVNQRGTAVDGPFRSRSEAEAAKRKQSKTLYKGMCPE